MRHFNSWDVIPDRPFELRADRSERLCRSIRTLLSGKRSQTLSATGTTLTQDRHRSAFSRAVLRYGIQAGFRTTLPLRHYTLRTTRTRVIGLLPISSIAPGLSSIGEPVPSEWCSAA